MHVLFCTFFPVSAVQKLLRKFRRFGHEWALYCLIFIAHARNGRIFTSGLKSDVIPTILLLKKTRMNDLSCDRNILRKILIAWVGCTNVIPGKPKKNPPYDFCWYYKITAMHGNFCTKFYTIVKRSNIHFITKFYWNISGIDKATQF